MAGNSERPGGSKDSAGGKSSGPKAKNFACPSCGAAVTIRCPGETLSAVCDSCLSIIDTQDENYFILQRYFAKTKQYKPKIPFGARAVLLGKKWECIGFVVRQDEASHYTWEEYLLFNPYYGYRWLTCNNDHWSLVTTIKKSPITKYQAATLDGKDYQLYYRGNASYKFVLGEFYWKIDTGGTVAMEDYIAPPYMLSMERDNNELVWSVSEYLPAEDVAKAFNLMKVNAPKGIAPNQPLVATQMWHQVSKTWMFFLCFLTVIQIFSAATAENKQVFQQGFAYVSNMKVVDLTTPVFKVEKPMANLAIKLYSPVANDWLYMEGDLVDNTKSETYPIEASVEYYQGYSDGEYWSEGGQSTTITISKVPAGEYYINMDLLSGSFPTTGEQKGCTLTVTRDAPQYGNYGWSLLFISIVPIFLWLLSYGNEKNRWHDSDFAPLHYRSES